MNCIILTTDNNLDEPEYAKLIILLIKSIRKYNSTIYIILGEFTNRTLDYNIKKEILKMNVHILRDIIFESSPTDINYFLRNFCKYYFSSKYNLLEKFNNLIYLDTDVIVLDDVNKLTINNNEIIVEEVPSFIKKLEEPYIGVIEHKLFYNWFDIINNSNKHIFDINYHNNRYLKDSDILISKRILESNLKIIHQTVGAYYPKHKLTENSILFHYDGFIDSGSFYKLKEYNNLLYKQYKVYIENILKIKIENNKQFYKGII